MAIGVGAVFFFIEAIAHMNVYSVMADVMPAMQKKEQTQLAQQ